MTKTYLNISWAMQSFAATKGAQRELETGNWFFSGEVPVELLEFVPPPVRSHEPKQVPNRVLKISASPSVFQPPGKNCAGEESKPIRLDDDSDRLSRRWRKGN